MAEQTNLRELAVPCKRQETHPPKASRMKTVILRNGMEWTIDSIRAEALDRLAVVLDAHEEGAGFNDLGGARADVAHAWLSLARVVDRERFYDVVVDIDPGMEEWFDAYAMLESAGVF